LPQECSCNECQEMVYPGEDNRLSQLGTGAAVMTAAAVCRSIGSSEGAPGIAVRCEAAASRVHYQLDCHRCCGAIVQVCACRSSGRRRRPRLVGRRRGGGLRPGRRRARPGQGWRGPGRGRLPGQRTRWRRRRRLLALLVGVWRQRGQPRHFVLRRQLVNVRAPAALQPDECCSHVFSDGFVAGPGHAQALPDVHSYHLHILLPLLRLQQGRVVSRLTVSRGGGWVNGRQYKQQATLVMAVQRWQFRGARMPALQQQAVGSKRERTLRAASTGARPEVYLRTSYQRPSFRSSAGRQVGE
jgi:hypothetical protein